MWNCQKALVIAATGQAAMFKLTPLLRQMKQLYAGASIDVVCETNQAEILSENSNVSRLFTLPDSPCRRETIGLGYSLRLQHYDLAIDCRSDSTSRYLARASRASRIHGFSSPKRKFFNWTVYSHSVARDPMESELKANLKLLQSSNVNINDDRVDFPSRPVFNLEICKKLRTANDRPLAVVSIADREFRPECPPTYLDDWSTDQAGSIYNLLAEKCLSINCVPVLVYDSHSQLFAADILSYSSHCKWLDVCTDSLHEVRDVFKQASIVISENELDGCIANAAGTPFVRWPQSRDSYEANEEMLLSFWPCITTLLFREKTLLRHSTQLDRKAA